MAADILEDEKRSLERAKSRNNGDLRKRLIIKTLPIVPTIFKAQSGLLTTGCRTTMDSPQRSVLQSRRSGRRISSNLQLRNKTEQINGICNIPSIPTNERKYGYYETIDGTLYPLADAILCIRCGNVSSSIIRVDWTWNV